MKIILEYTPSTGNITTKDDVYIGCYAGLEHLKLEEKSSTDVDVNQLVKLKDAGFSVDEMVALKDRGLL